VHIFYCAYQLIGSQGEGVSATGFFIDPHHVLTTSDIIMGEDGKFMDANSFEFSFTLRISTKQCMLTMYVSLRGLTNFSRTGGAHLDYSHLHLPHREPSFVENISYCWHHSVGSFSRFFPLY
jgi:hypothetical protein